jgi:oligopeptide/dipeptide ABC transporter ATP-binding protein
MSENKVLIQIEALKKYFPLKKRSILQKGILNVKAVDGVSVNIYEGETLGLVGESGCGKSTLGRTVIQLYEPTEGRTVYYGQNDAGQDLTKLSKEDMRALRKDLQIIFQDPYSSLNPRMTVGQIIGEGLLAHGIFKNERDPKYTEYITEVMDQCGLAPYFIHRYPHQFSGGQRQRIGIARALALKPKFIVCDEAVSALDVSIQSQIINLLIDLKKANKLTYLFITHDLSVVKFISDRIGVMYLGNLVELAPADRIFDRPFHPYTQALLEAIPRTDMESKQSLSILEGDIPSPINPPSGCKFHTRCKFASEKCKTVVPEWRELEDNHFVACHYPLNIKE